MTVARPYNLTALARSAFRAVRTTRVGRWALLAPFQVARRWGVPVPSRIYQHLHYKGPFAIEVRPGCRFRMYAHSHALENGLYWEGMQGHEPHTLLAWASLAENSRVVLDVGANTGLFALVAAAVSPGAAVHAFEPLARIAALLKQNVALNPAFQVTVHQSAVGGANDQLPIHDPGGDNCYSASLDADFLVGSKKDSYLVPVITLDQFAADQGLSAMDLVKIDVEGYEEPALAGMMSSIQRFRPVIVLEVIDRGRTRQNLDRILSSGYTLREIEGEGAASVGDARNVLLIPDERKDWVNAALRTARSVGD
jgi:FkbM family methyltransferase